MYQSENNVNIYLHLRTRFDEDITDYSCCLTQSPNQKASQQDGKGGVKILSSFRDYDWHVSLSFVVSTLLGIKTLVERFMFCKLRIGDSGVSIMWHKWLAARFLPDNGLEHYKL
jgi:hypothetical protein